MEYIRALIPLAMLAIYLLESRSAKANDVRYSGMTKVTVSFFVTAIVWFTLAVALLLLTQTFIDPPPSVAEHFGFAVFFLSMILIGVQNKSYVLYFDDNKIIRTRFFGAPMTVEMSELRGFKTKHYAQSSSKTHILTLASGKKLRIPIGMLGGVEQVELEKWLSKFAANHCPE